jgi:uncharacterized GH25 family protein
MRSKTCLIAAAALTAIAAPAAAHRAWLLPSTAVLSGTDQWVTVDAAISNDLFYPDHFPMPTDRIKVWAPDGSEAAIQNAATGRYRSTFDVKVDKPGTWKIGTEQASVMGSFKVGDVEWRVGGRRGPPRAPGAAAPAGARPERPSVASAAEIPANATDVKLTETIARNQVFVTAGAPTTEVFRPTGKGLELQPITHPDALVSDEPAQFRFLVDGKPAAGVKVEVVPGNKKFREAEGATTVTTGADGVARIAWPMPGVYWMSASLTDAKSGVPRATERRMTYVSTLEVPAP